MSTICCVGIIVVMQYIYFALAFFLAGAVPELTGFGVATVSMPILSLVMPLSVIIPLVAIISMAATGIVAWQGRTGGRYTKILALVLGSAVGVPLGMLFLNVISEQWLSVIFGVFLIAYALYGLLAHEHFLPRTKAVGGLVGSIAGFFGAVFNIHGPLVGLYEANDEDKSKQEIKGLTAAYMFISGVFTVSGHYISGRITPEVLYYTAFSLPFLAIGLAVGTMFSKQLSVDWVKKVIYTFVLCAGIALLV